MPDAPRPVAKASAFAGTVLLGSRIHADTRQLFGMIRQEADRMGVSLPSTIVTDIARMRTGASRLAYGSERIARASPTDAITHDMIGRQPYGRAVLGPGDVPSWMVDVELEVTRGSGTSTEWHHLRYIGQLPATIGALQEDIANYSDLLAQSYTVSVGEFGTILIGET